MKTSVNEATATTCPTCSRPLPSGAPAGLCPACLLAQGAETESGAGGPQTRFVPLSLAEVAALFPQLEILGLLGAGGMGAVYKARQPALDRFVALKVLPAGGDGANFEERFNREARALARLSHPNIVAVHEFGQAGALHYFLMEYVDGANLRQLEQASRLSAREALQIIPQICDALQYAHDEGVVHRDIKPENVLVDRKGRVKIADFGLAKILGHDPEAARLTVEGQVMGTPHYMAPEQVERPLAVDHRADIYSLGVVFYEMLTGDLPLGKFAPPSRKVQVDVRLDEIVLRALENDPARRYQQASEVKSSVATVVETPAAAKLGTPTIAQAGGDSPKPGVRYLRWLGIPAVVERDGEREVNFQGALGVFFVMLMASALMQQAVRWMTGTEYATTQLGFVTAAMMAIWAIRRTMNQPWGDEPPRRAANGTVIVLPTKRRRYLQDGLMVVALLAFVVGSHYLKTRVINPRLGVEQNASPAHQPATLDPETGVLAAKLPGGGMLELLALAPQETLPNGWWRPDGRPLTGSTVVVSGLNPVEPARGKTYFDFVFRADGLPAGAEVAQFSVWGGSTIRGGTVLMDGKTPPGAIRVRADLAKTAGLASFEVGLGLEPWQTLARHDPKKQANIRFRQAGDPAWDISLAHRAGTNGLAEVTGTYGPGQSDWQVRIVAVDHDGVAHTDVTSLSKIGPEALASTWTFRALPLTEVAEFQLQARRLHWVDFRAIAPNPKAPLPRGESLRLAEPFERTFDELIDFDTGRTVAFPVAIPGDNPFTSIGENILWAQENGFDAVAGRGELQVADADFAPLSNADWDTLTAQEVINRLHQGTFHPRTLKELRPGEFPATYAYRTREQGYGMIQLVAFDPERPGATVRLKRVVRPGTEPETAFGAPALLSFDELVDFDPGHAADFPPAEPGSNPLAGIGENVLWAQENGFDAVAGVGKLELLGVTVAEINDAEWEAMTPAQAEARLTSTGTKPRELTPQDPDRGNAPAYAFRTREGGVGLIRFVEFRNTRTGFTVQFRHAVRPGGAVEAIHARRDGKTGELVGRLPGRGVVTLSAQRPAVAGSTEWWRPDGRPVAGMAPHFAEDFARNVPTNPAAGRLWQLLLRAEHLPSPEDHLQFESPGALSRFFTGGAVVPRDGANPGVVFLHALWPDSATNAAVRVGIPMAQWHTIRSYEPLSRSFTKTSLGDDPRWNIEVHAAGVGIKGAQITVVFGTNYPGWNLRVLGTRLRQAPAVGTADVSVTNGPAVTRTFVFPELKTLDAVQNFQVQAQPLQWVEFANVALNFRDPVSPPTSHYFGALESRVFSDLLDFDTGGLATYKSGPSYQAGQGGNLFEGLADTVGWMRQNGFDAKAGTDQLHVVDMEVVPLENGDWDTLTASDLVDRLKHRVSRPQFLKPASGGQLPVTFGFRTRERGIGILQLVAFHPRESKATVSYKLVLGVGARPPAAPPVAALELRPVVPPGDTERHFELLSTAEGQPLRVAKTPWLRGDAFAGASWRMDPVSNTRVIVLRLSDSGRREFARLSAAHVREQVALVLSGRILFAPQIAAPMDVTTLDLGGLDRERGQFVELLAALNPQPAAGPVRFGKEHEAVLTKSGGGTFHWWNLAEGGDVSVSGLEPLWAKMAANPIPAEARKGSASGLDRSTREYHEFRRAMGGDLEALGGNPMPVVSGHDLTVVPLAGDGQPTTALEVAYRWELLHQEPEPENLLSTGTYALRTRRGFTGILEVLGWTQDQTGVRIRYREVLNSNAAP